MVDKENFVKDINVPGKEQMIISNRRQGKNIYTIKEDVAELEINSKKYGKLLFIIDASLLDIITKHYWGARCYRGHFYAYTHLGGYKYISLHRLITQCPNNLMVDHINHDTFDNRSKNLKICTNKENQHNRKNFEGVKVTKWGYQVQMRVKGKLKCFGTYKTLSEAKQVRISAEKEYRPYVKEINKYGHKPIYLDGVDVSRCKYLPYCNDKQGNCAFEPNCYFKQLARKTQECEELKNNLHIANTNHEAAEKECDRYLEALEEIKEIVSSTLDCGEWVGQGDNKMAKILDIINKAKESEECNLK